MKIAMLANARKIHTLRWCRFLRDSGHTVRLFSDDPPPPDFVYTDIRHVGPQWSWWRRNWHFRVCHDPLGNERFKWAAYHQAIHDFAPDVIHAQEAVGYGPSLAHFPEYARVLMPWGSDMESLADSPPKRAAMIRSGAAAAHVITTNACGLESHWSQLSGVPEERFELFSWGVDFGVFRRPDAETVAAVARRLGLSPTARVVLSPRMSRPYCRIDTIMEGWIATASQLPREAVLVILRGGGDDDFWRVLKGEIERTRATSVRLIDEMLTPEEMAAVYTRAEATIMMPRTDLVAMSLLEAMACGSLPILCDNPCYRTVADPVGEEGAMSDRGVAIYTSAATAEGVGGALRRWAALTTEQRAAAAQRNAEHIRTQHDWHHNAPRLLQVYERALDLAQRKSDRRH